jgi:SAM-dependent methyltransferase
VCDRHSQFTYDRKYARAGRINWRESLVCRGCGLANRLRLSCQVLEDLTGDRTDSHVYLTEQVTPVATAMRRRMRNLTCSEFLAPGLPGGSVDSRGIRHDDLTDLSFAAGAFDVVLSFDVLEHVPSYQLALGEIRRVLKDGGRCVITAPFDCSMDRNLVRAKQLKNGKIKHLLPPEYHGDPIGRRRGVLCYYTFGWELLEDMKSAGFADVMLRLSWSSDYANIGSEQPMLLGVA